MEECKHSSFVIHTNGVMECRGCRKLWTYCTRCCEEVEIENRNYDPEEIKLCEKCKKKGKEKEDEGNKDKV